MRIVLDLVVGINAAAGVLGLLIRHLRRQRRREQELLSHTDYQRELREQNREIDDERQRLGL